MTVSKSFIEVVFNLAQAKLLGLC